MSIPINQAIRQGLVQTAPLAASVFTYGLVFGALAQQAGLSTPEAPMMSALVFAGSAQFLALVTYLTRATFLIWLGQVNLPTQVSKALGYVPIGVLTAIIVPAVLVPDGRLDVSTGNPYILAGVASSGAALAFRSPLAAMAAGALTLIVIR